MVSGGRVKMETIAQAAGVSQSLVSKVLNNRPGVSDATREKVQRLLSQTGYQRRPRVRQARTVEIVFRAIGSALNPLLLRGFAASLQGSGYAMSVIDADNGAGWLDDLLHRGPTGVILVVTPVTEEVRDRLAAARIPVVVVDTIGDAPPSMNAVGSTHWRGGYLATRHLLDLGHRRIGMIAGPQGLVCAVARLGGYHAALREAGIPIDPTLVRSGGFQAAVARTLAHELLDQPDPPTGIVTGNDLQALGVIDACYDRQLRIPDDLSVVGYDDQDAAAVAVPALTTIHQPLAEMAEEAGRILDRLIENPGQPPIRLDLLTELVSRRTTAPPPRHCRRAVQDS